MGFSQDEFKKALSKFASGVTIVTYKNQGILSGITVSSFTSLSLTPPLVLFCLNDSSPAKIAIQESKGFSVHILGHDQVELSNMFARPDDSRIDFLKSLSSGHGISGAPHIPGCQAIIDCSLDSMVESGDHRIVIGKVESTIVQEDHNPLLYYNRNYRTLKEL
ncbi:flavin reductase family protein [Leptospira sp. GIMC2001]|uniref:flavin reductase family protein n=1 Tax=Leptospira sp. GIMC2001 TaxID=1513297 RepID=UPI00234A4798|nr:flavin reductase family protein [Leptospira sp. GIMC2001]WCL50472.1 flavin reductase family protein [Leptospira sp. GIMC2001]